MAQTDIPEDVTAPRQGRRRGRVTRHTGDRCDMCQVVVVVDADGRCPLGHQVVSSREMTGRRSSHLHVEISVDEPDVVAAYQEPEVGFAARPDLHVVDELALLGAEPAPPVAQPPRAAALSAADVAQPATVAAPVPPLGEGLQPVDDSWLPVQEHPLPVMEPAPPPPSQDRAQVPYKDLTPLAGSSLDLGELPWVEPAPLPTYESEPIDGEVLAPRSPLEIAAGAIFVALLVLVAVVLARTLG